MIKDGLNPYPSEASSIPIASEKGDSKEHQNKMKANTEKFHKSELDKASESESRILLDSMKLSSNDPAKKSKVEFDFFNSENIRGLSSRANNNEGMDRENTEDKTSKPKTYCCNFCKREFSSSQALGGHQNAHRQERDMAKKTPGMEACVLGHPHSPCYPCGGLSHHVYGSNSNRALGVRMDSMIQKPHSYGWNPPRYDHGRRWPQQAAMNPSLTLDRLMMESLQAHNNGFGVLGSSGNTRNEDSTIPFLHVDNSSSYVAESSGNALIKLTSTSTRDHQVKSAEESAEDHQVKSAEESAKVDDDHEPFELDLTLKL